MIVTHITSAEGAQPNEDLIAVIDGAQFTDLVVLDGGSSVADRHWLGGDSDAAWFVDRFAAALKNVIGARRSQRDSIGLALKEVAAEFEVRTAGLSVPTHAYPIAAMTWVRIARTEGAAKALVCCIGDCKVLLAQPDGRVEDIDPWVNPQEGVLLQEIGKLRNAGLLDAGARREALLPMLRARREFQNASVAPSSLCLYPQGPFDAREYTVAIAAGSTLLSMTDGFFRLVDAYGLCSIEQLAAWCMRDGLEAPLQALRKFEAERVASANMSVKAADDASVLACRIL